MEKLSKNFMWMAAANAVGSLFNILIVIRLARVLGTGAFGYLSYASTLVFYLTNFLDLGLSTYGIRHIAKNSPKASEFVSQIISFRILIAVALFISFVPAAILSGHSNEMKLLLVETSLLLFTFALATEWAFQGMEKMQMVFVSFATTTILQFALVYLFVNTPNDLLKVPIFQFLVGLPVIVFFLKRLQCRPRLFAVNFKKIKTYMTSSIVIWSISVLAQVYNGLDIVILGWFRSASEVGCFTIARKAIGGATFLMIFLANAVLPRLSSTFASDTIQFDHATKKFLKLIALISVFVFLPAIIFGKSLISVMFGSAYAAAAGPFNIMVAALVLVAFNLPYSTGLIAAFMEKEVLKQVAASAVLNLVLNFVLIPKFGMTGAAISFFFAEALAIIWILAVYRVKILHREGVTK